MAPLTAASHPIIFYDGVCGLCNRTVRFVLARDRHDLFRFASLQSALAHQALTSHGADPADLDTMYVMLDYQQPTERLFKKSDAVFFILRQLGGFWGGIGAVAGFLPRFFRDFGYNQVASRRYRLFGKYDSCPLPDEPTRAKFLDL
jgi:predicted DCC family thiol-disulfide oxidoreductase YuxK